MLLVYIINTVLIVGFVWAALMPDHARWLLEILGLWDKVQAIDGKKMHQWLRWLGQFMLLLAAVLAGSVMAGQHSSLWYIPAVQAAFFGIILWFLGKPPKPE